MLFSESPSRIIISLERNSQKAIEEIAARAHCPFTVLGSVGGAHLQVRVNGNEAINARVEGLELAWRNSLSEKLQAEALAAGRE